MRIYNQKLCVLVVLAICFLALSSYAQQTDQEDKTVLVKDPSRNRGFIGFSIKGGIGTTDGGDFNTLIQGYYDRWSGADDYANWDKIGAMMGFNAEILFNLTQTISVGIGAGTLTKNNMGEYGSQDPDLGFDWDRTYGFRVIPISVNLHLSFLTTRLFGFSIHGGVDYLMGNLTHNFNFQSNSGSSSRTEEVKCNTLGYHGGVSIDINFSSFVSFILEGGYRSADFKNWEGIVDSPEAGNFDGELYYYEVQLEEDGEYFPRMMVWPIEPSASYYRNVRLAAINLSGFTAQAGIRINF